MQLPPRPLFSRLSSCERASTQQKKIDFREQICTQLQKATKVNNFIHKKATKAEKSEKPWKRTTSIV